MTVMSGWTDELTVSITATFVITIVGCCASSPVWALAIVFVATNSRSEQIVFIGPPGVELLGNGEQSGLARLPSPIEVVHSDLTLRLHSVLSIASQPVP